MLKKVSMFLDPRCLGDKEIRESEGWKNAVEFAGKLVIWGTDAKAPLFYSPYPKNPELDKFFKVGFGESKELHKCFSSAHRIETNIALYPAPEEKFIQVKTRFFRQGQKEELVSFRIIFLLDGKVGTTLMSYMPTLSNQ